MLKFIKLSKSVVILFFSIIKTLFFTESLVVKGIIISTLIIVSASEENTIVPFSLSLIPSPSISYVYASK